MNCVLMATTPTKPDIAAPTPLTGTSGPVRVRSQAADPIVSGLDISRDQAADLSQQKPSQRDALQALLAFSSLHDQVRRRKALAARHNGFDAVVHVPEFEQHEQFILDEVLQLVAERAVAITGADGLAIALAENNEIVLRAAAGAIRPDVGARIDRDSAFSGACFRAAQIVICDDTETDPKVNVEACRKLGARSMVAVPLCGRRRVIGLLEAFSSWPFGFNDSDVRNLTLLAELVVSALKPEDEDRFAQSAQVAAAKLDPVKAIPTSVIAAPTLVKLALETPKTALQPVVSAPKDSKPAAEPTVDTTSEQTPTNPVVEAATKPAEGAVSESAVAAEPESESTLPSTGTESQHPSQRLWKVFVLVGIVILAAFAGGVWWKVSTSKLANEVVHNDATPVEPVNAPAKNTAPVS